MSTLNGFEQLISSASILTETNTRRLGIANVTVANDNGVSKMKVQHVNGDFLVFDNLSAMQSFIDDSVAEIAVLDKIKSRIEAPKRALYGQKNGQSA